MQTRHSREKTELDCFKPSSVMSTENMKSCYKDLHSNRSHKGLFNVFFGKGIKTGFEGKKMNLQTDAVPKRVAW